MDSDIKTGLRADIAKNDLEKQTFSSPSTSFSSSSSLYIGHERAGSGKRFFSLFPLPPTK
jgi:hypothetical protein